MKIDDFVTVREASKISDRSEGAIRRRIQEGKLSYIKVGYSVLIPRELAEQLQKKNSDMRGVVNDNE